MFSNVDFNRVIPNTVPPAQARQVYGGESTLGPNRCISSAMSPATVQAKIPPSQARNDDVINNE